MLYELGRLFKLLVDLVIYVVCAIPKVILFLLKEAIQTDVDEYTGYTIIGIVITICFVLAINSVF